MECKFLKHGIALSYDQVVKPCCDWAITPEYANANQLTQVDLSTWHSRVMSEKTELMLQGQWPSECAKCNRIESQGRYDSMRGNGENAYGHYQEGDITLEIRPGNVCNFACQTCWPDASTRVAEFYKKAMLIPESSSSKTIKDYSFLDNIATRIKNVVVLGGEPFYDKDCKKFLDWAEKNLSADILIFTNGSAIDFDFLTNYQGTITLVFSLDAIGKPAEYIRYGTEWETVKSNYLKVKTLPNVNVRVNITSSVYNYVYLEELIEFLVADWPSVVSFGAAYQAHFKESVVPLDKRSDIISSLTRAVDRISTSNIESGQRSNAVNAITAIINNLTTQLYNEELHSELKKFINSMDEVKRISMLDYCPELLFVK